jgi:uncharacterized membrane protein
MLVKALIAGVVAWPLLLGASAWRVGHGAPAGWPALTYLAASVLCHQQPERSFHTAGVKWPVCARCSGLYLAAPAGALMALAAAARWRATRRRVVTLLAIAAAPTAVIWVLEWLALAPMTNAVRFAAALPLGAAIAAVLVRTAYRLD